MEDEINTTGPDAASDPSIEAPQKAPVAAPAGGLLPNSPDPLITKAAEPVEETELERSKHALDTSIAPHSGVIGDDIAKILEEVKLPPRPKLKGSGDMLKALPVVPVAPVPEDSKPQAPAEAPAKEEYSIVTPLRTLKDDLQRIIRTRRITVVRAAALEQEKKRPTPVAPAEKKRNSERARRTFGLFFATILFVALGCAALFGTYIISSSGQSPVDVQSSSILFAESTIPLAIDNHTPSAIKQVLANARANPSNAIGSITRIVPTVIATSTDGTEQARLATLSEFLDALGIVPPPDLLRALSSDFFFGMYNGGQNAPLLVIPVTSYERAFAGMLAWEKSINSDLAPIYKQVSVLTTGPDGLPTERLFQDMVMRNFDVRALKDDSGNVVLYYSFPTSNILVIAENPFTFTEVLNRLQAERKL